MALPGDDFRRHLDLLNLAGENNVASWWGGMLFLLASLHASDCFLRTRGEETGAGTAWLAISGILLFFSADEVSSFHERMGGAGVSLGPAVWLSARDILTLSLATVGLLALLRLWRTPGHRRAAGGVFLGFLVLASVYAQETLEHRVAWSGDVVRTLRLLTEEGTELLGSLILLRVAMDQAFGTRNLAPTSGDTVPFGALGALNARALLLAGTACVALAALTAALPDQHRGHPADWFAASAFLAGGLVAWRPTSLRRGDEGMRRRRDAAALACVLASALAVVVSPVHLIRIGPVWSNLRLGELAVLAVVSGTILHLHRRPDALAAIVVSAAVVGVAAVVWSLSLFPVYLFTQILALVVFQAHATTERG